jgi:transcription elongation factor GreA
MAYADTVQVGSVVTIREREGDAEQYFIVAPKDADPRAGRIASDSPLGRALLGRRLGESVVIVAPQGSYTVKIESIAPTAP